ncbi:MAG: PilN domain-containing protein [Actinomycetota bacterium]
MRRINLLPREVQARRRARQQGVGLAVLFIVWVLVLVGVYLFRQTELRRERDRLAQAQARVATLNAQIRGLQQFANLERTVNDKQARLKTAMAGDVHWSRLLIELSMIIPQESWLTTFGGTAGAPAAPAPGQPAAPAKLGTITFSSTTFDFPGVAKWITRLQDLKSLQNVWVPNATSGTVATRDVVNFGSTADLSTQAASGRYQ